MVLPKKGSLPETIYCPERRRETKNFFQGWRSRMAVDRIRAATSTTGRIFRSLVAYYFLNLVGLAQAMRDITLPVRSIF
jgi:hypothetical protein